MWREFRRRSIRLILSVAILAANGVSPALTHSHADGDNPHSHGGESCHHDHSTEIAHDHAHDDHCTLSECAAHTHVSLFGLPISLPADQDDEQHETTPKIVALIAIVAVPSGLNLVGSENDFVFAPQPPCTAAPSMLVGTQPQILRPPHADRNLLCDAARFERSGVLLV